MSLNDPQWGKRGRSGPPDLDEIWRNVNRRLNELLGRRDGDGGAGGEPPRLQFPFGGVGLLIALVLVVWLASGFYIVDEGRRGVVTRFGKYTETTLRARAGTCRTRSKRSTSSTSPRSRLSRSTATPPPAARRAGCCC